MAMIWLLLLSASAAFVSAKDVFYEWNIRPRLSLPPFSPDCYTDSDLLLAEDQFPGPTIKAEVGDTVHIKWHNHHPSEGVSIHYHGLLMQDQPYTDGAGGISTCVVGPMQTFEQKFVADNDGTHYWHGHTSLDRMDGLQGMIVIEDPNDTEEQALKEMYDEERVLWLQDYYHKSGSSLRTSLDSGVFVGFPQSILINGKGMFGRCAEDPTLPQCDDSCSVDYLSSIPVEEGKTYLFRILNTGGFTSINVAMANHNMTIVKADGTFVEPVETNSLEVNVAQRFSVLVKADQASDKSYWISASAGRLGSGQSYLQYNKSAPPDSNSTMPAHDLNGAKLDLLLFSKDVSTHPQASLLADDVTPSRSSVIVTAQSVYPPLGDRGTIWTSNNVSMSLHAPKPLISMAYDAVNDNPGSLWPNTVIPGTVLVPDTPSSIWNYTLKPSEAGVSNVHLDHGLAVMQFVWGDIVDMVFQNTVTERGRAGSHAWHLHGHEVYVIGQGTGTFTEADKDTFNYVNPILRDTFSVWDLGWTAIRFKANNVGVWPFHCTMAIHAVSGMGFTIITSPDKLSAPPPGVTSCTMTSVDHDDAQICMPISEYMEGEGSSTSEIDLVVGDSQVSAGSTFVVFPALFTIVISSMFVCM